MRQDIRALVRGAYDLQKLRIHMGNRLCANFRVKLGIEPGEKEELAEADAKALLKALRASYERITDGVASLSRRRKTLPYQGLIDNYAELSLVKHYLSIEQEESQMFKDLGYMLRDEPIYNVFLKDVYGVGPAMAGVIISEIDIHKAKYPSSLWKYAGLDVSKGKGRSRKEDHLVEVEYTAADGTKKKRKSITFNPFLKTKLIGVLGSSFVKQSAEKSKYRRIYDDYKYRLECNPAHEEKSKGHRHNMAIRYAVKMFLIDLHSAWREIEGLPVPPPYHEAKLGLKHQTTYQL